MSLIAHSFKLFTDLTRDSKDGKYSPSKAGFVVAGGVFTLKMAGQLPNSPDDPLLWLVFMASVGAVEVAKKAINVIWGDKKDADAHP